MLLVKPTSPAASVARVFAWALVFLLVEGVVLLSPMTSALVMIAVAGCVVGTWALWDRPELGLLLVSFLGAVIIPREQTVVSLGGFHLDPMDVIVVWLMVLVFLRRLRTRALVVPSWSVLGPLLAFVGVALFSAMYAFAELRVSPTFIIGELRPIVYCAGCAIATATLARRRQVFLLVLGLFVIADVIAALVVYHQFGGTDPNLGTTPLPGSWQISLIGSGGGFGSVRVVPAGHVLLYLMANIAFGLLFAPIKPYWVKILLGIQVAFLGGALILTYTRAQWVASVIACLLIFAFLPRQARQAIARVALGSLLLAGLVITLVASSSLSVGGSIVPQAFAARVTSIVQPTDTLTTDSLEWRAFEIATSSAALMQHPLLGVGLGNDYRAITLLQGEANGVRWQLGGPGRLTRWVHDSYLYVAVKMGLLGIGVFLWFAAAFLIVGTRRYLSMKEGAAKFIVLAIVASFAGLLEWVIFEAHLMLPGSMTTVGLMVGIVAAVGSQTALWKTAASRVTANRTAGAIQ